jgi:predicted FMN-binding regulatory protein PaiB
MINNHILALLAIATNHPTMLVMASNSLSVHVDSIPIQFNGSTEDKHKLEKHFSITSFLTRQK